MFCLCSQFIYELTGQGWNFRSGCCGTWMDGEDQKTPKNSVAIHRQTVQSPGHLNQHLKKGTGCIGSVPMQRFCQWELLFLSSEYEVVSGDSKVDDLEL